MSQQPDFGNSAPLEIKKPASSDQSNFFNLLNSLKMHRFSIVIITNRDDSLRYEISRVNCKFKSRFSLCKCDLETVTHKFYLFLASFREQEERLKFQRLQLLSRQASSQISILESGVRGIGATLRDGVPVVVVTRSDAPLASTLPSSIKIMIDGKEEEYPVITEKRHIRFYSSSLQHLYATGIKFNQLILILTLNLTTQKVSQTDLIPLSLASGFISTAITNDKIQLITSAHAVTLETFALDPNVNIAVVTNAVNTNTTPLSGNFSYYFYVNKG